jgi:chloramphenicol 3-O-phosphotransferase
MTAAGEVILLNGTCCSGKTSLVREMQAASDKPYLVMASSDFIPMLAGKFTGVDDRIIKGLLEGKENVDEALHKAKASWSSPDSELPKLGFQITVRHEGGRAGFHSSCGPAGWNLIAGMHRAVAAMARAGNPVVMQDVVSEILMRDYCVALRGLTVYLVGLYCSQEELRRRERARSNRGAGAVDMQFDKVHVPGEYDLTVDTEKHNPKECAAMVLEHVQTRPPRAFDALAGKYGVVEISGWPVETF